MPSSSFFLRSSTTLISLCFITSCTAASPFTTAAATVARSSDGWSNWQIRDGSSCAELSGACESSSTCVLTDAPMTTCATYYLEDTKFAMSYECETYTMESAGNIVTSTCMSYHLEIQDHDGPQITRCETVTPTSGSACAIVTRTSVKLSTMPAIAASTMYIPDSTAVPSSFPPMGSSVRSSAGLWGTWGSWSSWSHSSSTSLHSPSIISTVVSSEVTTSITVWSSWGSCNPSPTTSWATSLSNPSISQVTSCTARILPTIISCSTDHLETSGSSVTYSCDTSVVIPSLLCPGSSSVVSADTSWSEWSESSPATQTKSASVLSDGSSWGRWPDSSMFTQTMSKSASCNTQPASVITSCSTASLQAAGNSITLSCATMTVTPSEICVITPAQTASSVGAGGFNWGSPNVGIANARTTAGTGAGTGTSSTQNPDSTAGFSTKGVQAYKGAADSFRKARLGTVIMIASAVMAIAISR